jgi:predicted 2-oxoglutarate/Fe(II)-dependent dioxygenase YbiX
MNNPFRIPEEFVFKLKTQDQVLKLHVNDLMNDVNDLHAIVDQYEPDPSTAKNMPASFRNSKHEILAQTDIVRKIFECVKDEVLKFWEVNGELQVSDYGFFFYTEGTRFSRHSDNGGFENGHSVIKQPTRKFTVLTYMDEYGVDYEGGELIFPDLIPPQIIKPSKCDIVVMPSNIYYMHEVKPVTKGKRLMLTIFLDVKRIYNESIERAVQITIGQ